MSKEVLGEIIIHLKNILFVYSIVIKKRNKQANQNYCNRKLNNNKKKKSSQVPLLFLYISSGRREFFGACGLTLHVTFNSYLRVS